LFFLIFLLAIEGTGSVSLTNGSGSGSGRPKNIRILRIRNTAGNYFKFLSDVQIPLEKLLAEKLGHTVPRPTYPGLREDNEFLQYKR
jgi:hypothetical protein